jgi:hypothetical protein
MELRPNLKHLVRRLIEARERRARRRRALRDRQLLDAAQKRPPDQR